MKNVISFDAPFVIAAILLSACAPFGNGNKPDCTIPGAFCVGLVTDIGPLNDGSFNQSAWGGVLAAQKDLGATVEYIATTDVKDYDKNISTFTDEGYQVIVTVGSNQTEATYNAAKNNPKTLFIGIDQTLSKDANHPDWPLSNLVGLGLYSPKMKQAFWLVRLVP